MSRPKAKVLILLLIALFSLKCTGQTTVVNGGEDPQKTLTSGIEYDPISLDPAKTDDAISGRIFSNIFDALLRFKEGSTEIEPALAESWEIKEDGKVLIFHLRRGVTFHDGTPFNARAVKISFDRQINPESSYYDEDLPNVFKDFALNMIEEVTVIDDFTVQFNLKRRFAPMLHNLAMFFGSSIVSPAALEKYGREFGRHPVGTGPFRLKSWERGKAIVLESNKEYWRGAPTLKNVVYKVMPGVQDALEDLNVGRLDLVSDILPPYLERLYFNPNIEILKGNGNNILALGFNCQQPPYTDERVRRAIATAINKERMVYSLLRGKGMVAHSPLPPGFLGYDSQIKQISYNPKLARKLLEEAGYSDGLTVKLSRFQTSLSGSGAFPLAIQADLRKVGIETEIVYFDSWDAYNRAVTRGELELFIDGWVADNADPDNFLYFLFHSRAMGESGNLFKYSNPRVDALLEEARETMDESKRAELYREVQKIVVEETPCVFLSHIRRIYAVHRRVKNFVVSPLRTERLENVYIEETKGQMVLEDSHGYGGSF